MSIFFIVRLFTMRKTLQKLLQVAAILVLLGGAIYVLGLTAQPTMFERFLPHSTKEDDHDHTDSEFQEQIVEIAFSPTAAKNIGLDDSAIITVDVIDYYKSLSFPAVVVERPGFSTITVPSPVSGVI